MLVGMQWSQGVVAEIGDELRNVVDLVVELPVGLQPEGEAVEAIVAAAVDVVLRHLRVVAIGVVGVVGLEAFDGRAALVHSVGHLRHLAQVLLVHGVPPRRSCARVVEQDRGLSKTCHG